MGYGARSTEHALDNAHPKPPRWHTGVSVLYGLPFVWIGLQHFIQPESFEAIVPPWLGWPGFWVHITGWTEVLLGVGVMLLRTRRLAAGLMVFQLVLLYLANLHMWLEDIPFQGIQLGTVGHVVRLVVQVLLLVGAIGVRRLGRRPT